MQDPANKPCLIEAGTSIDDRGKLMFANDFDFHDVKRFYMVSNHSAGFIRAWHAHKKEAKYVLVVSGTAIIGAVKIDNWEKPSRESLPNRYVLSAQKPSILYIPSGFANGFMTLSLDTRVMFFSTSNLEESKNDDYRYPARYWDIWNVEER